ncbi:hypothetical protein ABAC460_14600 [Asticcacaulis sp. AC460]|uniref:hypothetical protein n=1 Tax=Asticcacaulis sp. AC460 TaxID=1282360 RepID=UPI0003C3DECB|nr:hypothetical protein [Asticcacaulis sp. AC460]ESQ89007.1 hypothetical protein ABAC460_14600 [Asticcacaulis sp. AC460]
MSLSKRQKRINQLTYCPEPEAVALAGIARQDLEPVYDLTGADTGVKRRSNVFRVLGQSEEITSNQSAAGAKLIEIYAAWRGLGGKPGERELGWAIVSGNAAPDLVTDRMIENGHVWRQVMRFVGPSSGRLLTALVQDIMEGDGVAVRRPDGQAGVRWRLAVEAVTGERRPHAQAALVRRACEDLEAFWR